MTTKEGFNMTADISRGRSNILSKNNDSVLDKIGTGFILWHLLRRHKFELVVVWAVLVTITFIFPPVWSILADILRGN